MARSKKPNALLAALRSIGFARILILSALGFVGAWFAAALAISGVARIKAPQAALMAMPNESTALASRADQLFFVNPKNPPSEVELLARRALEHQAINAKALRVLGYMADAKGDTETAEKYIRMAARLSRREPGAQLWLVEASARRGDVAQTLIHYDIALRTKPDTQTILFPRLLTAIEDREIRVALKPYIRADNGWAKDFLRFANSNSKNLPVLVDLIVETGGLAEVESAKGQELDLLWRLVAENLFSEARRLYLLKLNGRIELLTDAKFDVTDRDVRFGPMNWQLIDDPEAGSFFTRKENERPPLLSIFANSATTRSVARKLLYLKPGDYMFSAQLSNLNRGNGGFLRWQLRCPAIPTAPVWSIDSTQMSLRSSFVIPANCPVQFLDLIASGGKDLTGLDATVASVAITSGG